jgi:DNA polymerase delta subunit 4
VEKTVLRNHIAMPQPRRKSGNTTSQSVGQPTLNFGTKSRVSKPSSRLSDVKKQKGEADLVRSASSASPTPVRDIEEPSEQAPAPASSKSENVVREQTKVELRLPKSEDDIKAERLTDADISKYWDAEEKKRIAPRGRHGPWLRGHDVRR